MATLRKTTQRPPWLKQRVTAAGVAAVSSLMRDFDLHTVCQSADCPNLGECFGAHTATFLILGGVCTRNCRFCSVAKGAPQQLDMHEPERVAQAVKTLGLKHAVVTSVTRDDLPDGGAGQFVACIQQIRQENPGTTVEVLVPDFGGDEVALTDVLDAAPDVFNHNIETVPRLYPTVRPEAKYRRSLDVLHTASQYPSIVVKSGIMLGLGETEAEVVQVLQDWAANGVQSITIGQYLQPSPQHLEIVEYIHPDQFKKYEQMGYAMGYRQVVSGPLVRSSYHAAMLLDEQRTKTSTSNGVK